MCAASRRLLCSLLGLVLLCSQPAIEARNLREAPAPSPVVSEETVLLNFADTLSNFQVSTFEGHTYLHAVGV